MWNGIRNYSIFDKKKRFSEKKIQKYADSRLYHLITASYSKRIPQHWQPCPRRKASCLRRNGFYVFSNLFTYKTLIKTPEQKLQ